MDCILKGGASDENEQTYWTFEQYNFDFLKDNAVGFFFLVVNSVEKHQPLFSVYHIPILAYGLLVFRLVGFIRRERGSVHRCFFGQITCYQLLHMAPSRTICRKWWMRPWEQTP